jgi:hypothetical protein
MLGVVHGLVRRIQQSLGVLSQARKSRDSETRGDTDGTHGRRLDRASNTFRDRESLLRLMIRQENGDLFAAVSERGPLRSCYSLDATSHFPKYVVRGGVTVRIVDRLVCEGIVGHGRTPSVRGYRGTDTTVAAHEHLGERGDRRAPEAIGNAGKTAGRPPPVDSDEAP